MRLFFIFLSLVLFGNSIAYSRRTDAEESAELDGKAGKVSGESSEYLGVLLPAEETATQSASSPVSAPSVKENSSSREQGEGEFLGVILPDDVNRSAAAPAPKPVPKPSTDVNRQPKVMETKKKVHSEFPWFTVVPEIGYIFFPKSDMEVNGFKATVEARNGFILKLHFDLGADDLAFEAAPLFAFESGGITANAGGFGNLSNIDLSNGGSFQAVGGQVSIVYRFAVKKFFPHIGFSFHGTYLMGRQIDYGAELYGRIPVGFTLYFAKKAALVFDMGFMFGVTGIRTPIKLPAILDTMPDDLQNGLKNAKTQEDFNNWYVENKTEVDQWIADPNNGLPEGYTANQLAADIANDQLSESIRFGQGFGFDLSIGIRFP